MALITQTLRLDELFPQEAPEMRADVELLHQGLFGGDPIAVRVAHTTVALRRREAMAVLVEAGA